MKGQERGLIRKLMYCGAAEIRGGVSKMLR